MCWHPRSCGPVYQSVPARSVSVSLYRKYCLKPSNVLVCMSSRSVLRLLYAYYICLYTQTVAAGARVLRWYFTRLADRWFFAHAVDTPKNHLDQKSGLQLRRLLTARFMCTIYRPKRHTQQWSIGWALRFSFSRPFLLQENISMSYWSDSPVNNIGHYPFLSVIGPNAKETCIWNKQCCLKLIRNSFEDKSLLFFMKSYCCCGECVKVCFLCMLHCSD